MDKRNRAEGWQYAKLTGHKNEELTKHLFDDDGDFKSGFLKRISKASLQIKEVCIGGLKEKDVESVLGGKTKSKTDMKITLSDDTAFNISIKKSKGGQVYLITDKHFIDGFEAQYDTLIPNEVKRAIQLFWGSAVDTLSIVKSINGKFKDYEIHKNRLVAESLACYDKTLYNCLLDWIDENIAEITDFCFSRGLAKNKEDWSDIVWYINTVGECDFDEIVCIKDLCNAVEEKVKYGKIGGGTTIQLPFGFVQWHSPRKTIPGCIQFHHSYNKIKEIMDDLHK